MVTTDDIQKRISDLPYKGLVLMVRVDRDEFNEDALRIAGNERQKIAS